MFLVSTLDIDFLIKILLEVFIFVLKEIPDVLFSYRAEEIVPQQTNSSAHSKDFKEWPVKAQFSLGKTPLAKSCTTQFVHLLVRMLLSVVSSVLVFLFITVLEMYKDVQNL